MISSTEVDWINFVKLLASKLQKNRDEKKLLSILLKLKAVPITLEILKLTKIGKIVNDLRKENISSEIEHLAKELVVIWKTIAASERKITKPEISPVKPSKTDHLFNNNLINAFDENTRYIVENATQNTKNGINDEFFLKGDNNNTRQNNIYENNNCTFNNKSKIGEDFFLQKNKSRTQIYSGRKVQGVAASSEKLPSLYDSCIRILIEHIDSLEYLGHVPADVIAPVLVKCNPSQLFNLEHFNPRLLNDTDSYWEKHAAREFKKPYGLRKTRISKYEQGKNGTEIFNNHSDEEADESEEEIDDEFDSWRDFYLAQLDAREEKLKKITANISATIKKSDPGPRVKLAFMSGTAKPPRNILRKQMQNNIASITNSRNQHLNTKQNIFNRSNETNNYNHPNSSYTSSSLSGSVIRVNSLEIDTEKYIAPKTQSSIKRNAPMMEKSLKLFKRYKFHR